MRMLPLTVSRSPYTWPDSAVMLPFTLSLSGPWGAAATVPEASSSDSARGRERRDRTGMAWTPGGTMRRGENFERALARRVQPARASLQSHLSLVTGPSVVPEAARAARPKPVVLLILDGWGHRDDPADNALAQADLPNWRRLWSGSPHTLIHTEGRHVGLPDGQMGNSEVGHMNLGAGRIVYQDLTRVDAAIEDGSFLDRKSTRLNSSQ